MYKSAGIVKLTVPAVPLLIMLLPGIVAPGVPKKPIIFVSVKLGKPVFLP